MVVWSRRRHQNDQAAQSGRIADADLGVGRRRIVLTIASREYNPLPVPDWIVDVLTIGSPVAVILTVREATLQWLKRRKQVNYMRKVLVYWLNKLNDEFVSPRYIAEIIHKISERFLQFGPGHLSYDEAYRISVSIDYLNGRLQDEGTINQTSDPRDYFCGVLREYTKGLDFLKLHKDLVSCRSERLPPSSTA